MNTVWDLIQFDKPIQILQQQQLNLYSNPTHVSLSLYNWWFKSINSTKNKFNKKDYYYYCCYCYYCHYYCYYYCYVLITNY